MHLCKRKAALLLLRSSLTLPQLDLGHPSRADHNHDLRSSILALPLYLLHLPQHYSINVCSVFRLSISAFLNTTFGPYSRCLSIPVNPLSSSPNRCHFLTCVSFRLCISFPHRLHYLHSRQILQTLTSHVSAPYSLPQKIPDLQILSCCACHGWRGYLHCLSSIDLEKGLKADHQLRLGPTTAGHQSSFRWSHKQHSGSYFQQFQAV